MSSTGAYTRGVATGILIGLGAAFVLDKFRQKPGGNRTGNSPLRGLEVGWTRERTDVTFISRREAPEAAGDPVRVAGDRFNRTGGAPGARSEPEKLSMPGRPGQFVDSEGSVTPAKRSIDIRG